MPYNICFRGYKSSLFCWCGYQNIQLICPISVKVYKVYTYKDMKRNSIDTLSKLLTSALLHFCRSNSWWVFLFNFKLLFFLGFQNRIDSSVKAIMSLSATLPLAIVLKCFSLLLYPIYLAILGYTWLYCYTWLYWALLLYPKSTILGLSFPGQKDLCPLNQFSRAPWQNVLSVHT